jgi:hypothetical protein
MSFLELASTQESSHELVCFSYDFFLMSFPNLTLGKGLQQAG